MALITPYCTLVEADVFLSTSSTWNNASDTEKNSALFWGRIYIDSKYACVDWTTLDTTPSYPEELKYANALLAEAYIDGTLFDVDETGNRVLTSKRVKAGDVEVEKRYQGDRSFSIGNKIDEFPEVTALLAEYCNKKNKNPILITRV